MKHLLLFIFPFVFIKATGQITVINESLTASHSDIIFTGGIENIISINSENRADTFELKSHNEKDEIYRINQNKFHFISFDTTGINLEVYRNNKRVSSKKFQIIPVKTSGLFVGDLRIKDSFPKSIMNKSSYLSFRTEHPLYKPICDVVQFSISIYSSKNIFTHTTSLTDSVSKGLYKYEGIESLKVDSMSYLEMDVSGNNIPNRILSFIQLLGKGDRLFIENITILGHYNKTKRYLNSVVICKFSE